MKHSKLELTLPYSEIEQGAKDQIENILNEPSLLKLAIMPDVHMGYDLPIGSVALTDRRIFPSWVGYDIGCGMCCLRTDVFAKDVLGDNEKKESIFKAIYAAIPTGVKKGGSFQEAVDYPEFVSALNDEEFSSDMNQRKSRQLGTLGSGNHFLEIGVNQFDKVAITVHSGSRGLGHGIATKYMKFSNGEGLEVNSELGKAYIQDMNYALQFALDNRRVMIMRVMDILKLDYNSYRTINENHNHAEILEGGKVLHRKGATPAENGKLGIIPANMRDGVFITNGLGNEQFLNSASHGAGRVMSRSKAKKNLNMGEFLKSMHSVVAKVQESTLDEAPMAYKDINVVLEHQEGVLINVIDNFKPIINVKA